LEYDWETDFQYINRRCVLLSIREKLLDFKRRLSDRKMYSIVVVAISAVALWGFYQYKHAADYDRNWITNITGLFMKWLDM